MPMHPHPQHLPPHPPRAARPTPGARPAARTAFTLAEILVVLLIIVLLLAAAVPAFRALTGSRSIDTTQNLVAAMLGRARTLALNDKSHPIGVFFHLDPATDRTVLRLVQLNDASLDDPDPFDQYKGWATGVSYKQADLTATPPIRADRVAFITIDNDVKKADGSTGKPMVKIYRCIQSHTSATGNAPPAIENAPFANDYWEEYREGNLSLVPNTDPQVLPADVGVQLINDPRTTSPATAVDRYVRTGLILFDPMGRLAYRRYRVAYDSPLGLVLHLDSNRRDLGSVSGAGTRLYSCYGLTIYPLDEFRGRPGASEGDYSFAVPGLNAPPTLQDERDEEKWLDDNTTPLLINRYSGTIGATE